jgi:hypothetical protein
VGIEMKKIYALLLLMIAVIVVSGCCCYTGRTFATGESPYSASQSDPNMVPSDYDFGIINNNNA